MSLLPQKLDFTIWGGATFRKRLTLYTGSTPTPGTERNLTGYTALLIIRDKPLGTNIYITLTESSGIVLGGAAGTIDIVITATQTAGFTWTSGVYDLTITAPSAGDTDALIYGTFTVKGV